MSPDHFAVFDPGYWSVKGKWRSQYPGCLFLRSTQQIETQYMQRNKSMKGFTQRTFAHHNHGPLKTEVGIHENTLTSYRFTTSPSLMQVPYSPILATPDLSSEPVICQSAGSLSLMFFPFVLRRERLESQRDGDWVEILRNELLFAVCGS
jgi:hypothetical protein